MHPLFPNIKVFYQELVSTNDTHRIYIEQSGNQEGIPILVLHHGPGAISSPFYRRFFDPEKYRIIIMDQRGSGQSEPFGTLQDNTTSDLIQDIQYIRKYLKIDKWMIYGCGWGTTLGLLYAEKYPTEIVGMLLIGTQLCRLKDLHWFYQEGANIIYPEHWENFLSPLKSQEFGDTICAYHNLLHGNDDLIKMNAAKSWKSWHTNCMTLQSHQTTHEPINKHHNYSMALIQNHYLLNRFFIQENQILENIEQLQNIPAYIIHGRYDMVSPLKSSWLLNKSWPSSKLFIIRDAGHSPAEPGLTDAIVVSSNLLYDEVLQ